MLNIRINALKTKLLPSEKDFIEKKLKSLEKYCSYFKRDLDLEVNIEKSLNSQSGDIYSAEARLFIPGNDIHCQVKASSIKEAANLLKDDLKRLIIEHRKTKESLFRRTARKLKEKLTWHRLKP
ncbi:MAG TPA: HPF/RaiA family ribosome-associated protein [Candidatus Paceibacterota bacterium]|nr:HPF/RaiA family ribosome-associated protein [Candidatus Paceibacterota bacterium]